MLGCSWGSSLLITSLVSLLLPDWTLHCFFVSFGPYLCYWWLIPGPILIKTHIFVPITKVTKSYFPHKLYSAWFKIEECPQNQTKVIFYLFLFFIMKLWIEIRKLDKEGKEIIVQCVIVLIDYFSQSISSLSPSERNLII